MKYLLAIVLLLTNAFAGVQFFNSGSNNITISASFPDVTSNWTLCEHFKPTVTIASHVILLDRQTAGGTQVQFDFGIDSPQDIYVWSGTAYIIHGSNGVVNDTNLHDICLNRDGSNLWTLYYDGAQINQVTDSYNQSPSNANALHIGANIAGNFQFQSIQSELAIWNTVLTADQITAYHRGVSPNLIDATHLQLYLPLYFSGGNGTLAADLSGHGWNGTITTGGGNVLTANHCACSPPAGAESH